jgi:FAD/FMN-containing dehydrogenase
MPEEPLSAGLVDRRTFLLVAGAHWATAVWPAKRSVVPPIRGQVIRPGAPSYAAIAPGYNETYASVRPALIALPVDVADVRTAVAWAAARGMPLRARSSTRRWRP